MKLRLDVDPEPAEFVRRPNRFIVECLHREELVAAHIPNSGRLTGLLLPGTRIWLSPIPGGVRTRKTRWTALLVQAPNSPVIVSVDTRIPNALVLAALRSRQLQEFADWRLVRPEFPIANERIDFLLSNHQNRHMALEVKSVSLVEGATGLFPDAVSERGTRHLHTLSALAAKDGWSASVLFVAQRSDVAEVRAAAEIDPEFAGALSFARQSGVQLLARQCRVSPEIVELAEEIPVRT